jgi:hypothetical protein
MTPINGEWIYSDYFGNVMNGHFDFDKGFALVNFMEKVNIIMKIMNSS